MTFSERLVSWPAWFVVTLVSVAPVCMGLVDYATRTDFEFLIFFLIPLFMVTWRWGGRAGYGYAMLGILLHAIADRLTQPVYTYPIFFYWNLAQDLGVLALFVYLLMRLKSALRQLHDANDRLAGANRELQEALQMNNEFLNIAAHDLKNPLTAILGLSELMVQPGATQKPEDIAGDAQTIHEDAHRMLDLIRNLLDVAKHESRQLRPDPVDLDLVAVTHRLLAQNVKHAAKKNIILLNEVAGEDTVWADNLLTEQIMDNLISNAIKFSPPGKNVYLRSRTQNDAVLWEVHDQGPGLSAEDKAKLFQKFARLSARPTGGENSTRLGLSIVKLLADAMGGRVWCESELGRGATFIVALPRTKPPAPPVRAAPGATQEHL